MGDRAPGVMPVIVRLPVEVDVVNSDEVYDELVTAIAPGVDAVVADMTATTFCDSSGVHAILRAHENAAARGVEMRLAVSSVSSVHRVLELVGLGRLMPVYGSIAEAIDPA